MNNSSLPRISLTSTPWAAKHAAAVSAFCLITLLSTQSVAAPVPSFSQTSAGTALPTSIRATYKVYKGGILLGSVDEHFERDGDMYKITSVTRADGPFSALIKEQISYLSEGKIGADGLVPVLFSSARKSDTSKSFTSRFNWETHELLRERVERDVSGRSERETFALPEGTQDRLSSMYQFMITAPTEQRVTTIMTQGKHAEKYLYLKQGEPVMTSPAGQFATVHYARDAKVGESKAELWLAKNHNYLPVRIIFTDPKGASLEQRLVELVSR